MNKKTAREKPAKPEAVIEVLYCTGCGEPVQFGREPISRNSPGEHSVRSGLLRVARSVEGMDWKGHRFGWTFCPRIVVTHARDPAHSPQRWRKLALAYYERPQGSLGSRRGRSQEKTYPARMRAHLTPGGTLRTLRNLQGITQEVLAKASEVAQSEISRIERDLTKMAAWQAVKLGKALNVHPDVLLAATRKS